MRKSSQPAKTRPISEPISITALAEAAGVSRQRIYRLIAQGHIHALSMVGGIVIAPEEAERVLAAAVVIGTGKGGKRVRFDFSKEQR